MPAENHVSGSLNALKTAAQRLQLLPEDEAEVRFLIEQHLKCLPRCSAGMYSTL